MAVSGATLENPTRKHFAAFLLLSVLLHALFAVWFALRGQAIFLGGPLGIGGGSDIVFQLAAGDPILDVPTDHDFEVESDLTVQEEIPEEIVVEEAVEIPVTEEAAIPVAPAKEVPQEKPVKPEPQEASAPKKSGEQGAADESKKNRPGTALTGQEISAAFSGRTLNLTAGRLDIPSGNRLMDMKIHLYPDGTSRVQLVYFHYKTFHREETSTRKFKGDGKWWIDGNKFCHRAMVVDYGAVNCYELNQRSNGDLELYFEGCAGNSSAICSNGRLGAKGRLQSGLN
ncbi:MAG TPA: hypothetical protein DDW95_07990 [Alphaproteobacteria bacterium]|jgi:hypothetical protein|nr:hypothetical protein [Alphaproteobacteria bacterium]HBA44035.1 hypothetical protein [Alphaproteobacteria bacterium]HBC54836.1 hypothetical protein [Alphaproteobacteria bacterium]HBF98473.1 hypothetical protein [Alphaproteobacteria bacterium]HCO91444.1 hypothetical protein [Alphaproteobacteria bacterium]